MEPQHDFRNSPRSLRQPAGPWTWRQRSSFAESARSRHAHHIDEPDMAAGVAMTLGTSGHLAPRQLATR